MKTLTWFLLLTLSFSACSKDISTSQEVLFFAKDERAYLYDLVGGEILEERSFDLSEHVYDVKYNPETEEIFYFTAPYWVADSFGQGEENCIDVSSCYGKIYRSTWGSDPSLVYEMFGRIYEWDISKEGGIFMVTYSPEEGRQFISTDMEGRVIYAESYEFDEARDFGDLVTFDSYSYQVSGTFNELYLSTFDHADGGIITEKVYENPIMVSTSFTNIKPDETLLQFDALELEEGEYVYKLFFYNLQEKTLEAIRVQDFNKQGKTLWSQSGDQLTIGLKSGLSYYDLNDLNFYTIQDASYTPLAWASLSNKIILLSEEGPMFVYHFDTEILETLPEAFSAFNLIDIDGLEVFQSGY